MRNFTHKLILIAALMLFAMPLAAMAQESTQIFGGYSYLRGDDDDGGVDLHGWNVSVNQNFKKWIGLKADFSGHYGEVSVISTLNKSDLNAYLFLVGPQFNLPGTDRVKPFAHVLFGAMRTSLTTFPTTGRVTLRDSAFAMAVGGGLDVKLTDVIAIRLFQTDYVLTRFDDDTQNNFRASTGIVFKFKN
jgi:opacity protein-like surface antigen